VLDRDEEHLDGEVIASAETASRVGRELNAPADDELLLYVVHGMLHLVGFDDQTPAAARQMRKEEQKILDQLAPPVAHGAGRREPRRAIQTRTGRNRE
jgi:probable rRNA maturation factor